MNLNRVNFSFRKASLFVEDQFNSIEISQNKTFLYFDNNSGFKNTRLVCHNCSNKIELWVSLGNQTISAFLPLTKINAYHDSLN